MSSERIAKLEAALQKISDIRDSIVGAQCFNFSEHAYPLVAVLREAGFDGAGYEIASENLGTLLERNQALKARVAELEAKLAFFALDPSWCTPEERNVLGLIRALKWEELDFVERCGSGWPQLLARAILSNDLVERPEKGGTR